MHRSNSDKTKTQVPRQQQRKTELDSPLVQGTAPVPDKRRTLREIFCESVRVYFLLVTGAVQIVRQLIRLGWGWLRRH